MSYCLISYHFMILDGAPTKRRPCIDFILITKCLINLTFTSWDVFLWRVPYIVHTWILIYTLFVNVVLMLAHKSSWTYHDNEGESIRLDTCSCFCSDTNWMLYCLVPFHKTGKGIKGMASVMQVLCFQIFKPSQKSRVSTSF